MGAVAEQKLIAKLMLRLRDPELRGTDAARLWRAAQQVFSEACRGVMDSVAKKFSSRARKWALINEVIGVFARECDLYYDRSIGGITRVRRAKGLIKEAAEKNNDQLTADELFDEYATAGMALTEVMYTLRSAKSSWRKPTPSRHLIDSCDVCWCTGIRTAQAKFYCRYHAPRPNNHDYKSAAALILWRPKDDSSDVAATYFWQVVRRLQRDVPSGLTGKDNADHVLRQLRSGKRQRPNAFQCRPVDFARLWPAFPFTRMYLVRHGARRIDFDSATSIVAALDPLGHRYRKLHSDFHAACARDQRILVEMMQMAEAWLETWAFRRQHQGPARRGIAEGWVNPPKINGHRFSREDRLNRRPLARRFRPP